MVRLRKLNGALLCFCILTSVLISIFQMNTHDTYSRMCNRILNQNRYPKNFQIQHRTQNNNLSNRNSTKMTIKNTKQTF